MNFSNRKYLTAWLGLFAMWLVVCAPVISQLLASTGAQDAPFAALCSASAPALQTASAWLPARRISDSATSGTVRSKTGALGSTPDVDTVAHHGPAGSMNACGYCDLLAHHVPVPALPALALSIVVVMIGTAVSTLSTHFTPLGAFPSGRPRGPPLSS